MDVSFDPESGAKTDSSSVASWDIVSAPHSCSLCMGVVIDIPAEFGPFMTDDQRSDANFIVNLPQTREEVMTGSTRGCPLFRLLDENGREQRRRNDEGVTLSDSPSKLHFYFGRVFCEQHDEAWNYASPWLAELLADSGDSVGTLLTPHRTIEREVMSSTACATMRTWISDCDASHEACKFPTERFMPTRLLFVGSQVSTHLRLHETVDHDELEWASLSYCWGGDLPFKTTSATYRDRLDRIDYDELPLTLQHAVTVTRGLGLSYLWIDCLCIIQDDPSDMTGQLAAMPLIYRLSRVTISASCAKTCHDGFLQDRTLPSPREPFELRCRDHQGNIGKIVLVTHSWPLRYEEPVNDRAWTHQEALLAPRLLMFTATQIRWRCNHHRAVIGGCCPYTTGTTSTPYVINHTIADADSLPSTWQIVAGDHCYRSVTHEQDKFVSLSALAAEFALANKDRYLAGLWESQLPHALLWTTTQARQRPSTWRAPSWSWASTQNSIEWGHGPVDVNSVDATLLHGEAVPTVSQLPYGAIKSAYLRIRCRILRVRRLPPQLDPLGREWDKATLGFPDHTSDCSWEAWHCRMHHDDVDSTETADQLYCAKISESAMSNIGYQFGLVLIRDTKRAEPAYLRIGDYIYGCEECKDDPFQDEEYQILDLY